MPDSAYLPIVAEQEPCAKPQIINMTALEGPTLARSRELLEYWRNLLPPTGLPLRTAIDLAAIPHLVGNLMLHVPVEGRADWRIRLVGSSITARYGVDNTGKTAGEILGSEGAAMLDRDYRQAIQSRTPTTYLMRYLLWDRDRLLFDRAHLLVERILLPVIGRDGATPWMMSGVFFRN